LSGTRGKPPPILAARYENPTFPFEFTLGLNDLTPEGAVSDNTSTDVPKYWWQNNDNEEWVVSARWDADGVAATRSPEDLVGRSIWSRRYNENKPSTSLIVQLQGRGAFGKFATSPGNEKK
jgi:hypothetical protein